MNQLEFIVDSLNLKFKTCELDKEYLAVSQAKGYHIFLNSKKADTIKKDLMNNITLKEFVNKYPLAQISNELLIIQGIYKDYDNKDVVDISSINLNNGYGGYEIKFNDLKEREENGSKEWVFEIHGNQIRAFYIPNGFKTPPLADSYARMVQYTNCMIDTTSLTIKEDARSGWMGINHDYDKMTLKEKKQLLEKMRSIRVVGRCSQDDSPRMHAQNIAIIAAETTSWDVFLRAHLNIMNDRFERASDGSYAQARRKTYIKELEELNINVLDLLLGISLRIENSSKNHYYGNIYRLGRALSETKDRNKIEVQMLKMIGDQKLDDYNRAVIYFLYRNYCYYLNNDDTKKIDKKMKKAIKLLPKYLSDSIEK